MTRFTMRPELSAQGIRKAPNPMVMPLLVYLQEPLDGNMQAQMFVEQGCGQLRHVALWIQHFRRITLVDTAYQLETPHEFHGKKMLIHEYITHTWPLHNIAIMNNIQFKCSRLGAKVIASVNVFDVVPPDTREELAESAHQNLVNKGLFMVIVLRNDTWTRRICTDENRYRDGYIFPHARGHTFYHNWVAESLQKFLIKRGFEIVSDKSRYKYVVLLCRKR